MTQCIYHVVQTAIVAGMAALAVILLRLIFRKMPRRLTVMLWAVVAIRLICPLSVTSVVGLIPTEEVGEVVMQTVAPKATTPTVPASVPSSETLADDNSVAPPLSTEVSKTTRGLSFWLTVVWLTGMGGMLVYGIVSTARLRRTLRFAVKEEGNVYRCETVTSPFVLGVFRPRVYLPYTLNGEALTCVLSHERTHIRHGDHLIKPLAYGLLSIYWFQPLLWVAYWLLCRDIEAACDERVVRALSDEERRTYSTVLLSFSGRRRPIAACPIAFGETGVKERVKRVMHYKKPTVWILCAAILIGATASVCLLTDRAPYDGATMEGGKLWVSTSKSGSNEAVYLIEGQRFSAADIGGTRFAATIDKVNDRAMTVTVALDEPLYLDGVLTDTVSIPHDETVTLHAAQAKDGMYGTYSFHVELPTARDTIAAEDSAMLGGWIPITPHTRYEAEDVLLILKETYFVMTFKEKSDYEMVGTYVKEDGRLVLTEDAGLTEYVFLCDDRSGTLTFDEAASYRHKKAKTQSLPDGKTLAFCYEWNCEEQGIGNHYTIKAADGTTVFEGKTTHRLNESWSSEQGLLTIWETALLEVGLTVRSERMVDMRRKTVSEPLEYVMASEGDVRVALWEEQGVCGVSVYEVKYEEDLGYRERFRIPLRAMTSREELTSAHIEDGELILEYGKDDLHIEAFTLATAQPLTRRLLIIKKNETMTDALYGTYGVCSNGASPFTIDTEAFVAYRAGNNLRLLQYAGVRRAAVYLDGAYIDLKEALESGALTLEQLETLCESDEREGLVPGGVDTFRDGGTKKYSYKADDDLHTISFCHTLEGNNDVYVGVYLA